MTTHDACRSWLLLIALAIVGASSGCQPDTRPQPPAHDTLRPGDLPGESSAGAAGSFSPDSMTAKDRCPSKLHDVEGAMMLFYLMHKQLPSRLEELMGLPDAPRDFICPDSNTPYAYIPNGLRKPGGAKRIIVCDAVPNRDGTRWCIFIMDGRPGTAPALDVQRIAEPIFLGYQ